MNYGNPGEDDPDGDELRHCAAGVLHNASNVSRVAHLIVQAPGMLESLQVHLVPVSTPSSVTPHATLWDDAVVSISLPLIQAVVSKMYLSSIVSS
jgi:hypothetical protein